MSEHAPAPKAPRWLSARVSRLGPVRVGALVALAVWGLSLAVTHGVMALAGGGGWTATLAASVCALLLAPPIVWLVLKLAAELDRTRTQIDVLATLDDLTGVFNRRHFMSIADRELARCRRYDMDGALILIDADHFKRVNDSHGHLCGDALLREMARATAKSLRQPDLLARFGGEELAAFLPHTDPLGALDVAERVREQIGSLRLAWQGRAVGTTVSIGVAALGSGHPNLDALVHDADTALRAAKEAGRNCVRAAPIQPRRGETRPVHSR